MRHIQASSRAPALSQRAATTPAAPLVVQAYLPCPSEGSLCAYAAFLARTCAAPTVRQYLKGLKYIYGAMGVELPWGSFRRLDCLLTGLKRLRGEGTRRKLPITPQLLLEFAARLPPGSAWHALFACCVFGVFGMLRRSNLVPGAVSLFGQAKHITRADVEFVRAYYALRIRVRFTKTLRFQQRVLEVWIQGDPSPAAAVDPVRLWFGYVARVPAPPDAPAFCFLNSEGALCPLTFPGLGAGIKRLVAATGRDPAHYASHSLRRGGATFAVQAGVDPFRVQAAGDWATPASFQLYVQLGAPERLSCTAAMLAALRA